MTVFITILHLTVFQTILDQYNSNINQHRNLAKIDIADATMKYIQVHTTNNIMLQLYSDYK